MFDFIFILLLGAGFFFYPIFDRRAIRKLVREQTGREVLIPKDRLIYRCFETFGIGFALGGLAGLLIKRLSVLEGGVVGGLLGILAGILIRWIGKARKKPDLDPQGKAR
jgi:hypothetical protein